MAKPRSPQPAALQKTDLELLSPVAGARIVERSNAAMWVVYLLLAALVAAIAWASFAQVDIVVRANARIIPDGKEQAIASLEGGILRELYVKEGEQVLEGDDLAMLDPTRFEASKAEGQARVLALQAAVARLTAEATGQALVFPSELKGSPVLVQGETDSYRARARALQEAVALNQGSIGLLNKELAVAQGLSAKGLMSEVEVMRLRRQVNDLQMQSQERVNRFRQDASAELVKVRSELAQMQEQMVVRQDALQRTVLKSPIRGIVKTIRNHTLGGVVPAGGTLMEILPVGSRVLVEARIKPADIGFIKLGQETTIKLSAYEYTIYGALKGTVQSISPDVLGDAEKAAAGADGTYYRALIRADRNSLNAGGKKLNVVPGMSGSAEIRTGERTVMDFLLRPMLKSQEAFQER
jgi:membrane fusion protein, adhesin transport system